MYINPYDATLGWKNQSKTTFTFSTTHPENLVGWNEITIKKLKKLYLTAKENNDLTFKFNSFTFDINKVKEFLLLKDI